MKLTADAKFGLYLYCFVCFIVVLLL